NLKQIMQYLKNARFTCENVSIKLQIRYIAAIDMLATTANTSTQPQASPPGPFVPDSGRQLSPAVRSRRRSNWNTSTEHAPIDCFCFAFSPTFFLCEVTY